MPSDTALNTPLHSLHQQWGGKMVAFAGYHLPLTYVGGGLLAEHLHTRASASLFDVSHMGQVTLPAGDESAATLAALTPADPSALAEGACKYTLLTNAAGGVIDDCIIGNDGDRGWFIVLNASRKAVDMAHIRAALPDSAMLKELESRALLAVQGPAAAAVVGDLFPSATTLKFMQSAWCALDGDEYRVSRCGYTGEDGYEISAPSAAATALAEKIAQYDSVKPAGLGARDSLRLEAGLCLYGNDLDETTSPIEAGLLWTIPKKRRVADAGFPGAAVVCRHIEEGAPRRLVGLLPQGKMPVRQGAVVKFNGEAAGVVTSGSHSPTLEKPVALAYLRSDIAADAELVAEVRGKDIPCRQTKPPFVPARYVR